MQKSYVATTTINFVDFNFYVRPGDLLVHDIINHNRLTVYRNGQIVKVVKQTALGISAFLKNNFIEPVTEAAPVVVIETTKVVVVAPKVVVAPVALPEPQKQYTKRDKAVAREVPIEEFQKKAEPAEEPVEIEN